MYSRQPYNSVPYSQFDEVVTSAPAAQPNGWHRPFEQAPLRVIIPVALVASGLVWCPQPIAALPNTVTIDKWQQPLSKPVPVARVVQSGGDPPFNTFQPNTQRIDKWLVPLSKPVLPVAQGWPGHSVVPFNTAQINTQRIDKWLVPLSKPVAVARVVQSGGDPPFNTRQINSATIDKWQVPLSVAAPVTKAQQGNSFTPFDTAQTNTATIDKWFQPLSIAVPVAQARPGLSFVPFNTAQINTQRIDKWLVPLSKPVAVATATQGNSFVPFNTVQQVAFTYDKYQQPLSAVPATFRAQPGYSLVPFDTAQTNTATIDKWLQPLGVAASVARAVHTPVSFVALPFTQYPLGWFQPLSQAALVAIRAQQGSAFVPFNTVQIVSPFGWHQPFSAPVALSRVAATQPTFIVVPFDVPRGWHQPFSIAVTISTPSQSSIIYVPFVAAPSVGISGMAWHSPLSSPVRAVTYSLQPDYSDWIFQTEQLAPEAPPRQRHPGAQITVRRPGGFLGRYHVSMTMADDSHQRIGDADSGYLGKHRQNVGNRTSPQRSSGGLRGFLRKPR